MHTELPEILLGAGTVLTVDQVKKAVSAGAEFIVAPGFNPDVVDEVLRIDEKRRLLIKQVDSIRQQINQNADKIKQQVSNGQKPEQTDIDHGRELKSQLKDVEPEPKQVEMALRLI